MLICAMKILLVEDEEKLANALKHGLETAGYAVDIVTDGKKAFSRISLHRDDYDLVILDLMLPAMDGLTICKEMRAQNITMPILVLTARAEVETKVSLLLSGADDYLVKPFSFAELSARVRALLRRPSESLPEVLRSGQIELDVGKRTVMYAGTPVPLTLKEFGLLEYFLRHPGQVVNRDELLSHLWDFNYAGFSNVVDVHIKNLRQKLAAAGGEGILETIRGVGYRFRA